MKNVCPGLRGEGALLPAECGLDSLGLDAIVVRELRDRFTGPEAFRHRFEQRDRTYWDRRANPASMGVMDKVLALLPTDASPPRVTYNPGHIAVGGRGRNFFWLHPRQKRPHNVVDCMVGDENRDTWLQKLQAAGIGAYKIDSSNKNIRVPLTRRELAEHEDLIRELLAASEEQGRH